MNTNNQPIYHVRKTRLGYSVLCKLGNMRKEQEFSIYPISDPTTVLIQSDTRICRINTETKTAMLSQAHANGSYTPHLSPLLGAMQIEVPTALIDAILEAPTAGDKIELHTGKLIDSQVQQFQS